MIKSYASYFISFMLSNIKTTDKIKEIILFGSAARDQATKESDIDIFIDTNKPDKSLEKEVDNILKEFYKSREALLFKSKGIDNKINLIIGKIDDWHDLKKSIESDGIVLYGPYIGKKIQGRKYVLISWDKIGLNRGAFLNKIYGFKVKNKKYSGLIDEFEGKKAGKSSIIIPANYLKEITKEITKYKVHAKTLEIYM